MANNVKDLKILDFFKKPNNNFQMHFTIKIKFDLHLTIELCIKNFRLKNYEY